jgi:hypothetical protein
MANLLWAHATMGWQNKKLFLAVGSRLLEPDVLEGCNEQDISVILWAHARIKVKKFTFPPPPLPKIRGINLRKAGCLPYTIESQDVSTFGEPRLDDAEKLVCCLAQFWNADLCRGLASRVETLSVSNPQASSNLLWAFAELNMVEGYEAVVDKMCSQLEGDSGLARSATAQGVANMLWALSVIGQQVCPVSCTHPAVGPWISTIDYGQHLQDDLAHILLQPIGARLIVSIWSEVALRCGLH